MSEIPEDILKIVDDMCSKYVYEGPSEQEVAEALLAERERATQVERDRCEWEIRNLGLIVQDGTCYVARQAVIDAIRSGEEAGKVFKVQSGRINPITKISD